MTYANTEELWLPSRAVTWSCGRRHGSRERGRLISPRDGTPRSSLHGAPLSSWRKTAAWRDALHCTGSPTNRPAADHHRRSAVVSGLFVLDKWLVLSESA